jgi:hypothetical protein
MLTSRSQMNRLTKRSYSDGMTTTVNYYYGYLPTTPTRGLLAEAYNFLGMRPAS